MRNSTENTDKKSSKIGSKCLNKEETCRDQKEKEAQEEKNNNTT